MIKKAVCAECGKTFEYLYNKYPIKYCSDECRQNAKRKYFKEYRHAQPTKRSEQLEKFERQARTQGLTYGQLQAMKWLEAEREGKSNDVDFL